MSPWQAVCPTEIAARMAGAARAARGCRIVVAGHLLLWWPS